MAVFPTKPSSPILRPVDGLPSPADLARELRHLPGFVFLDTSSAEVNPESGPHERFSLITAKPSRILRGNLFDKADFEVLKEAFEFRRHSAGLTPDLGFPTDGLYGCISYEGDFLLGEYHECLLFDHSSQTWHEQGSLSTLRDNSSLPSSDCPAVFRHEMEREAFCQKVTRTQEYIAAGDIYQVNLSHRLIADVAADFEPFLLHERLREQSPAPYSAYLDLCDRQIISSSPEQFLSMSGRTIQTRPIKGTRPRFRDRREDEKSAYDLITSPKELAELIMITDLERNDLGQICEFGSVEATELLKLERFAQVFHLVSTVKGTLRPGIDPVTALRACFPGGSITGAPKKRAREIIEELEPVERGPYTGAIGCFGFNGESRFNIAIRTAICEAGSLHFHVGAGIVADSDPEQEWEETLHKAAGILQACEKATDSSF
ncbi:MAG: aminodeoxychorismate synthase component I [Verrucomicrobiales bacterium]|nr:aminodeoxychorismate synthase component I [Verrucomicrobiales bacterium]